MGKESHIEVYSSSTSSLVRSLAIGYRSPITAYSLSTANPNILFVSTFAGTIYKWDWIEGKKLARWDISSQITGLAVAAMPDADEDTVYTIDKSDKRGKWMVTAHKLVAGNQGSGSELSILCKSQEPITGLKVLERGRTLIATSGKRLMIGLRNDLHQTPLASITYTWREITLPEYITCFDAHLPVTSTELHSAGSEKLKNRNVVSNPSVNIVVGNTKGELYIYKDLLDILTQRERVDKAGKAAGLTASLQHWHREAVSTVKWSRDGKHPEFILNRFDSYRKQVIISSLVALRRFLCCGSSTPAQGSIFPIYRQLSKVSSSPLPALRMHLGSPIIPSWYCLPRS